ncbi:hypothetical protein G3570_01850 [Balneolaceae bacterium YR4-1]|uniref:MtN3 and saliva related transmembrane protein n=1 Tax=Halalkalibaculum roseum TaxID=2709311 RepID=A0A6M1SK11_9BACT|nr:SemiSWEET transporter [Halalkalibaculum roseum]NGP75359.1 hypothetical protein [Halalkalibaculum roseum]
MTAIMILGLVAAGLTTVAFIPQVHKTWKTKSAKDLSLGMYLIFTSGVVLWLIYGILRKDIPIIAANAVTLSLTLVLLYFKIFYKE